MSSYFTLTLDTTPPNLEILTPAYTTSFALTEIRLHCDEKLLINHDAYIIDSEGIEHEVIFDYHDNEFIAHLYFSDYPLGLATVYARVNDEVLNDSGWVSKRFNIVDSIKMKLKIGTDRMNLHNSEKTRSLKFGHKNRKTTVGTEAV